MSFKMSSYKSPAIFIKSKKNPKTYTSFCDKLLYMYFLIKPIVIYNFIETDRIENYMIQF